MTALRFSGLALSLAAAGTLGAQECKINESSPYQINSAKIYLNKARSGKEVEKPNHLRSAIRVLTEKPESMAKNEIGRQYMLGQALFLWSERPEVGIRVTKRSDLGFATNGDQQVDIVSALDTALTAVETAMPQCAAETTKLRRNVFAKLFNPAVGLAKENQLDSAFALTNRSLLIYRESPSAYTLLADIATKRHDSKGAIAAFTRAAELAAKDTSATAQQIRKQSLFNAAILTLQGAEAMDEGTARNAELGQARSMLEAYLTVVPDDANAKQALARAASLAGDKTAVANIYGDMIANPSKYSDIQLFEAGTGAARANQPAEAAQLLEAGLSQNPYYRDALFNLANVYFSSESADKMLPIARRLVEVDPGNPDNWRLLAGAYQLQNRKATSAAAKKATTDSLIRYLERSDKLPVRVAISGFRHQGAKHTLTGSIENLGAAAATYALKVEFLDKSGAVVATQTESVGPVAAKARAEFSVSVEQPGIVAFRYAPLP